MPLTFYLEYVIIILVLNDGMVLSLQHNQPGGDEMAKAIAKVSVSAIGVLFGGFALSTLWGWFVVPVFEAPALGLVPGMGIWVLMNFMTFRYYGYNRGRSFREEILELVLLALLVPAFFLLLGWIVSWFM